MTSCHVYPVAFYTCLWQWQVVRLSYLLFISVTMTNSMRSFHFLLSLFCNYQLYHKTFVSISTLVHKFLNIAILIWSASSVSELIIFENIQDLFQNISRPKFQTSYLIKLCDKILWLENSIILLTFFKWRDTANYFQSFNQISRPKHKFPSNSRPFQDLECQNQIPYLSRFSRPDGTPFFPTLSQ